jgi:uncharacterized membrane protein
MYSRGRLDALGDGIFAVAMTLLVLDVRLPEDFDPKTSTELLSGVLALSPKFFPYALSFFVLALRWLWEAEERRERMYTRRYAQLWILMLFLVTCTPFTTIILGRFPLPSAVWLYVANIALLSVMSFLLAGNARELGEVAWRARIVSLCVLLFSSVLAIALSFVDPTRAPWALVISLLAPAVNRWMGHGDGRSPPPPSGREA